MVPIVQPLRGCRRSQNVENYILWWFTVAGSRRKRHNVPLAPGSKEDTANCREFFHDIRQRGLPDPLLVVCDGAPDMIRAIEECLPRTARQRCLAHKVRNLQSKVTRRPLA